MFLSLLVFNAWNQFFFLKRIVILHTANCNSTPPLAPFYQMEYGFFFAKCIYEMVIFVYVYEYWFMEPQAQHSISCHFYMIGFYVDC